MGKRKYRVRFRVSGYVTDEIFANTEQEARDAENLDLDMHDLDDLDEVEIISQSCEQIGGPPEPRKELQLPDGRLFRFDSGFAPDTRWIRCDGMPGEWWTDGYAAMILAEPPPEEYQDNGRKFVDLSKLAKDLDRSVLSSAGNARINMRYMPLLEGEGVSVWISPGDGPIFGKRDGAPVSIVMPRKSAT